MMSAPLIIGNTLLKLDAVESTNTWAHTLLKNQNIHEGLVVWALDQTRGRGQMGTNWHSVPGESLTFSVILSPGFLPVKDQFLLNKAISAGLHEYATSRLPASVFIKWPNDLYIGYKKAGGVLIENILSGTGIQHSIIGIGLNLNQHVFEGLPGATSFLQETGKRYNPEEELHLLLSILDKWYLKLRNGHQEEIRLRYSQCLLGWQRPLKFRHKDAVFTGMVSAVDNAGYLHLTLEDGTSEKFGMKEIEWLF